MIAKLFENFDLPDGAPDEDEAPPPEPVFTQMELSAARQEAWNDGYLTAARHHAGGQGLEARHAFATLLARSDEMDSRLSVMAEQNAGAIAHWLVRAFIAVFPALAAEAMDQRIQRVARLLQPLLKSQASFEIRDQTGPALRCETISELWQQVGNRLIEEPHGGDIIIAWPQGEARIKNETVWEEIQRAIIPLAEDDPQTAAFHFTVRRMELTGHV